MSANSNVKPSEIFPSIPGIEPVSLAAAGTAQTTWIDPANFGRWITGVLHCGAINTASIALTAQQSASATGTSPKNLNIFGTGLVNTVSATDLAFDLALDKEMDITNGFRWLQFTITATGGTGALVSLDLNQGPAVWET